jgi:hypothetical protein
MHTLGLLLAYHSFIFNQRLVIFRNGHQENDGCNTLKAMNPFLSLATLTADVKHAIGQVTNDKNSLCDTGRLDSRPQNILIAGKEVTLANTINGIKVTGEGGRLSKHENAKEKMTSGNVLFS